MEEGTGSIEDVKETFAGVDGFALYKKEDEEEGSNYTSYHDEASKKALSPPLADGKSLRSRKSQKSSKLGSQHASEPQMASRRVSDDFE